MHYETLIFDLDGTISDPFVGISASVNHALNSAGFEAVDPEAVRPLIGPPLNEIFEKLAGADATSRMQDLIDHYRDRYATIGYAENRLYPGIPELLARLSGLGYRMGICTAKRADYAMKILEHFGLAERFDFVDGGGMQANKKQQIARILQGGVNARTSLMIGDRAGDIEAANANSVDGLAVLWGFGGKEELATANPKWVAASPVELQSILDR